MLLMFEKGVRIGITKAVKRYSKANNNYMKDHYNLDKTSTYLQYLEENNLHKWAIIHKLSGRKVDDFTPEKMDELIKKEKGQKDECSTYRKPRSIIKA